MLFNKDKSKEQLLKLQLPHTAVNCLYTLTKTRIGQIRSSIASYTTRMTALEPTSYDLEGILRELHLLQKQMERVEHLTEYLSEIIMPQEGTVTSLMDYRIIEISPEDADIYIPLISRELDMIEQSMKNASEEYKSLTENEFKEQMSHYKSAMTRRDELSLLKEYLMFYRYKI